MFQQEEKIKKHHHHTGSHSKATSAVSKEFCPPKMQDLEPVKEKKVWRPSLKFVAIAINPAIYLLFSMFYFTYFTLIN